MRAPRRLAALAALAMTGGALCGCGADPYPGLPDAGTLHIALITGMNGFDPAQSSEDTRTICVLNTYDALYQYHYLKRPYEAEPCLADGMPEVSPDGLTWRIRLKPGLRYVDDPCFEATVGRGRVATASDFVFDVKRLMDAHTQSPGSWIFDGKIVGLDEFVKASGSTPKDPGRSAYRKEDGYPDVEGLKAVDDRTIEIRLPQPYPQLLWILTMPYTSLYPPEAVAKYGAEFLNHAVGTGPYRVVEYKPSQRMVLERNPNFREDLYPAEGGPGDREAGLLALAGRKLPLNDRVVCTVMVEDQPRWLYFESGFLDRVAIPKDNFDSAIDSTTRELNGRMRARGVRLFKEASMEVIYDSFNMNDAVVGKGPGSKAIRGALSLAVNYAWAARNLYNDRVEDMQGVIPRGCAEFDPDYRNPWKPHPGETRESVLPRARKVLADAGFAGGRGIPPITMDVLDSATDDEHFLAQQRDAKDLGIELKPYKTTWQEMNARIEHGRAQMWGSAWIADYPDAQNFLQLLYGPNGPPLPNAAAYANPAFDALYDQASTMAPSAQRTEIYRRMERMAMEDCPWIVRYRRINYYMSQPWLEGYRPHDLSQKVFKYYRLDTDRRGRDLSDLNAGRPLAPILVLLAFGALLAGTVLLSGASRRGW